ncbi:transposase [Dictyobacter kobayashii]|uniref:transposase n=1 Tax=Dictyobacter kobayashii TaxID=2014872 RepID=UPI003530C8E6
MTSVPTHTATQAQERVEWYRRRWIVEDYHQGLKTGCHMEEREIRDYEGLRTLLGIIAPLPCACCNCVCFRVNVLTSWHGQ